MDVSAARFTVEQEESNQFLYIFQNLMDFNFFLNERYFWTLTMKRRFILRTVRQENCVRSFTSA